MNIKKLISPVLKANIGNYELTNGIQIECFSSRRSSVDWCNIGLATDYKDILEVEDMTEASILFGYDDDFDILMDGYIRKTVNDNHFDYVIKDDMFRLNDTIVKASFYECVPQDIIKYVLSIAKITNYKLNETNYMKKEVVSINSKNAVQTMQYLNKIWNLEHNFFFQNKIFYWGEEETQKDFYILEEDETILSLNKYGDLWEAETIGIPWIHHSQKIYVMHSKISGEFVVEQTLIKSDMDGFIRMYISFGGNENG